MVSANVLLGLLRKIRVRCRIVFVGDVNQLPSIEWGQVLSDLINSKGERRGVVGEGRVRADHLGRDAGVARPRRADREGSAQLPRRMSVASR